MHKLAQLDQRYVWHPFTQMRDWAKREPIVMTRGKGSVLEDLHGKNISMPTLPFGQICTVTIIRKSTRP